MSEDRKELFMELMCKVCHEGGLGGMLDYGNPPNIEKFPELNEAWSALSEAAGNWQAAVDELEEEFGLSPWEYES